MSYFSHSKNKPIEMMGMHPAHLINALNRQATEAARLDEPIPGEKLQLIGRLAVTLAKKGCRLEAAVLRPEECSEF